MATMIDAIYYPDQTTECKRPLFLIPVEAGFPSPSEDYVEKRTFCCGSADGFPYDQPF